MSLTAQIGASEATFKLSQKIVSSLAEKFSFKFEDGWATVSSRTLENIQKRLKRDKRRANPASSIKHPRTAFSFFTQKQRPLSQAAHPEATFGQLSRFVSEAWKLLTPEQMASFKALELADKERYQVERATVLATAAATPVVESAEAPVAAEATKEKKVRKVKAKTDEAAAPVAATPAVEATPATPAPKKAKSAKAAAPAAAPVAAPAAAPVEAAPAKKVKTPKAPATPAAEATTVEAKPAEVKAAKPASAKPKAVKA
jgi:hypothetical protein